VAAFDFDNTLIYNDLGEAFMFARAFCRHGVPPLPVEDGSFLAVLDHPAIPRESIKRLASLKDSYPERLDYAAELLCIYEAFCDADMLAAYRWTRLFFGSLLESDFARLGAHVFAEQCSLPLRRDTVGDFSWSQGIRIFGAVQDLIGRLRERGWKVLIITASPEILIRSVIHHWQIPVGQVLGMQLATKSGILMPEIIEPMTSRQGKVERLQQAGHAEIALAMGDSQNDFELLKHAGTKIFLDRGKPVLATAAKELGAMIQPFWKP